MLSNTTRLELAPNGNGNGPRRERDACAALEGPLKAMCAQAEGGSSAPPAGPGVRHNLTVMIYNSLQSWNRWSAPTAPPEAQNNKTRGGAALVVLGLELDDGVIPLARTDLAPKRCIFYGDSITEGVASQCTHAPSCTAGGDLCSNSATKTWGRAVAAALDCEYSQIGFGGLGWSVPGGGGVVPVFTPGDPAQSSWNQVYAGAPRTFLGAFAPDYVFILHATNDGLRERAQSVAPVTASVHGWLKAMRAAVGASPHVFLTVPFGGFGSVQDPIGALQAGFQLCVARPPGPPGAL